MKAVAGLLLSVLALSPKLPAQSNDAGAPPSLVEVYWQSSKTIVAPGITNLVVLDPDITRAETGYDTIIFFGLVRGETVVLGYAGNKPVSIRVRVLARPPVVVSPEMLRRQAEMGQGIISSNVQGSAGNGSTSFDVLSGVSWSQPMGPDGHFDFIGQIEDNDTAYSHPFNLRSASVFYHSPGMEVRGLDFSVDLVGGGPQRDIGGFSFNDFAQLRGAGVTLNRGQNRYTFFAGTTVPYYYLTLGATRDVAGFAFYRRQSDHLAFFGASSFINSPVNVIGLSPGRLNNIMQTAGLSYRFNDRWRMQSAGGVSNRGGMARGEVDYAGHRVTMFTLGSVSAPLFPLNQVQSLLTGSSFVRSVASFKNTDRYMETFSYQHTIVKPFGTLVHPGSSDVISPGVVVNINHRESLSLSYSYSRNSGGFTKSASTGNQFGATLNSQITPRITNNAQFSIGSVQDPLQLSSEDEFSFHDGVSLPVKYGSMAVGFFYDHRNPSLVQKLNSELGLLAPALQTLFLQDPVNFVNSNNLPPEIRAILEAQQPISTSAFASAQLRLGSKMMLNPNVSIGRSANGTSQSWSPFFGYSLGYQLRPSFQLTSSLANSYFLANTLGSVQRTTVFSLGFLKTFSAAPNAFMPVHHSRTIEGRVFRDSNVNGMFNAGEQGLTSIVVRLDNGESATTDEQGRFKFSGVSAGVHQVLLDLTQFRNPVRMTTHGSAEVDLIKDRIAVVNFGVVDFARLLGSVFNDLRFEGKRPADARGLSGVHITLDDGQQKQSLVTDGTGSFEVDDVLPGDYKVTVDPETLPPNYVLPSGTLQVHISPVSSMAIDIPVRALRSISGRVFLRVPADPATQPVEPGKLKIGGISQSGTDKRGSQAGGQARHIGQQGAGEPKSETEYTLVPMAGIQLRAANATAITDENGSFLLRDLPAGDLAIAVIPLKPVPPGMKVPSGVVQMPPEPIQVQGATIVINNPDLVPYLIGKTAAQVRDAALHPAPKPAAPAVKPATPAGSGTESPATEGSPAGLASPTNDAPGSGGARNRGASPMR
jgi:hypothetical protein